MVVKILIDNVVHKLNKVYDYLIKPKDEGNVKLGKRVRVNFGKGSGQAREGIIVKVVEDACNTSKLKVVEEILDTDSFIDMDRLKLAKWMYKMYFCNVYTALKLMLPPMPNKKLQQKELIGKQITIVTLCVDKNIIEEDIANKKVISGKQIRLLRQLMDTPKLPIEDIINGLGISRNIIKAVEQKGYLKIIQQDATTEDYSAIKQTDKLTPTEEQKAVIDSLNEKLAKGEFNVSLLHGVTGSGKTEVYLQTIEECLKQGKNAIVLVPEISLTYQTKHRFISRFKDMVAVLHSKMTVLERQTEYKRIVNGKARIVIGPRSALFAPLDNIGLIIIDEEHDSSYVSQSTPRYNTREVATRIAYVKKAVLLLGSATPDICTMYKAKTGKIDYYTLKSRPGKSVMPEIEIVDMKLDRLTNTSNILSNRLKEEIERNIKDNEQSFIFLNRRGFSSYITCKTCGKTLRCPNCDVNLTYHKKNGLLLCHYCSYCETLSNICPICGADTLSEGGIGTERVEKEIKDIFPEATISRMDMDTTVKRGSHEDILNRFKEDNTNILVGTQMISKGHDIPNVTLVGVINADYMIGDDYTVSEKAFSNLLQVAGRAGRGDKKGRVILQACDTENYILESVKEGSYVSFYNKEIKFREMAGYPPFTDILVVELISKNREKLILDSKKIYNIFSKTNKYKLYSPKAPFVGKINNKYRIQMIIKTFVNDEILDLLYEKLNEYDKIKDVSVTVSVTKNPVRLS